MNQPNKNANKGNQAVAQAIKLIRGQIVTLGNKIKNAPDADKPALEQEMKELMASIGMVYTGVQPAEQVEGEAPAEATVGGTILINLKATQEGIEASIEQPAGDAADNSPQPKLSLWQRFKGFVSRNKVILLVGAAGALAIGAGVYYLSQGRTIAEASFKRMAEATAESTPETATEASSIFASIGSWFVRVGAAIKGYAVAAWNWVAGLFQRAPAAPAAPVETVVVAPADAPAAAA